MEEFEADIQPCYDCEEGKSSDNNTAMTECRDCLVGKYASGKKNKYCAECSTKELKYQDELGQKDCKTCQPGKLSEGTKCLARSTRI